MNFQNAQFEASYGLSGQLPESGGVEIVFAGRSNVGKSSLINKLLNRKAIARVSSMPGKTTTINFYAVDGARFVDLPGYGYAKVGREEKRRWMELMEGYFAMGRDIGLVVQLVDIRHKPTVDDLTMISFLIEQELPFLIALTKADKLSKAQREKRLSELKAEIPYGGEIIMIATSAENGDGIEELKAVLEEVCEEEPQDGEDSDRQE